uniref:ArsR-family transcriptional regulator n=1 Tax=Streptomyces rimofaciens TaxID=504097 RepID=H9BDX7_9ACTN|nr:ArsR-family transcriptional regulator [Streptomyces rimofaciens]
MSLAQIAGLLADRTRAAFCTALLDGRAWTAGELARHAGVARSTASEHLSRLISAGLLAEERQGRHRYVRLAGPEVAALIEDLTSWSPPDPAPGNLRGASRTSAEARARTCYDHLAGRLGVALSDALLGQGIVTDDAGLSITGHGRTRLAELGVPLPVRTGSRPVVRSCLDWTERRGHLGGALGAALCRAALERHWVERIGSGRALKITAAGERAFRELFGVDLLAGDADV